MELKSNKIDTLLIRQLKQTANKPVTRLVLLTGFNTPPTPSQEGSQVQPVNKQIAQFFLYSSAKPNFQFSIFQLPFISYDIIKIKPLSLQSQQKTLL